MAQKADEATWLAARHAKVKLVNRTKNNYILELPTGRYRLDAGRTMLTVRSILDYEDLKRLVDEGSLVVEKA